MGNRWRCDRVIDYIILEMMSMWWDYWRQYMGKWCWCRLVIGDTTWVIGGVVIGLLTTSSRISCRCDVVIGGSTREIGRNVVWGNWRHHMGNRWQCDGVIDYIMSEMMSIWCSNWWQHQGYRTQCDIVIGGSTCVIGGDVIGLLVTSSRKWCRCDVVIGYSTWEIGRIVIR